MTSDRTRGVATNLLLDAEVTHVGYEIVIGRFAFVRPWDGKYLGRFIAVRNLDLQLKNANKLIIERYIKHIRVYLRTLFFSFLIFYKRFCNDFYLKFNGNKMLDKNRCRKAFKRFTVLELT